MAAASWQHHGMARISKRQHHGNKHGISAAQHGAVCKALVA